MVALRDLLLTRNFPFGVREPRARQQLLQLPPVDVYYSYWLLSEALTPVMLKEAGYADTCLSRTHGHDLYLDTALRRLPTLRVKDCDQL